MTTIYCNGDYLIADKRTSRMWSNRHDSISRRDPGLGKYVNQRDDSIKIMLPPKDAVLTFDKRTVVAYASAGCVPSIDAMISTMNSPYCSDFAVYLGFMTRHPVRMGADFSTVLLFDDGSHATVEFNGCPDDIVNRRSPNVKHFKRHELSVRGSGKAWYDTQLHYLKRKADIVDLFLTSTYNDTSSSCSYSVYGREERMLFTKVRHTDDDVAAAVTRVHAMTSPYRGAKDHCCVESDQY